MESFLVEKDVILLVVVLQYFAGFSCRRQFKLGIEHRLTLDGKANLVLGKGHGGDETLLGLVDSWTTKSQPRESMQNSVSQWPNRHECISMIVQRLLEP